MLKVFDRMSSEFGFHVLNASRSVRSVASDLKHAITKLIDEPTTPTEHNVSPLVPVKDKPAPAKPSTNVIDLNKEALLLKFAAIDIGSNSIKLVVVDAAASDSFAVLTREKETVRLGHETFLQGYLGRDAILRAIDCVRRFRSIAEARGAERIVATATAAVREANNCANFIKAVEQKTGINVEVLSGIEEARLIGLAAAQGCSAKGAATLNIDIGGGSTEISIFREGLPLTLHSIRLGAVGLTERFLKSDPPRPKQIKDLRTEIRAAVERPARELHDCQWDSVTGTSGTILAIGNALRAWTSNDHAVQPAEAVIKLGKLAQFNASLAAMTTAERRNAARLTAQRAEIIVAGGLMLEGIMHALGIDALTTCEWALREGVIIDRLRDWEAQSRPPMPDIADQKLRGVHAVGKRFGYEEAHSHQVARLAETIFDALAASVNLTRHQRLLLSAAALVARRGLSHRARVASQAFVLLDREF